MKINSTQYLNINNIFFMENSSIYLTNKIAIGNYDNKIYIFENFNPIISWDNEGPIDQLLEKIINFLK